jgi:hypothetical protein
MFQYRTHIVIRHRVKRIFFLLVQPCIPPPQSPKAKLINADFVDMMKWKVLGNLRFSLNQPQKPADDWYIVISKNIIKTCEYLGTVELGFNVMKEGEILFRYKRVLL